MPRTAVKTASWLTDTQEQPRADALSGNRIRRRARFYRVYLLRAALLCPLLLLALAAAVSGSASTGAAAPPDRNWPGRAAATEAVLDWLSGPNPGLVDGRLLLWSGARSIETPVDRDADTAGVATLSVEVDSFVVVDGAGNRFTAEVQVAVDNQNRSRVLSGPSLTPLPVLDPDASRNTGPWPGRDAGPATESVTAAVRAWAAAYTSGDPAALRLTVGDPDRGQTYLPLTGVATADHGRAVRRAGPGDGGGAGGPDRRLGLGYRPAVAGDHRRQSGYPTTAGHVRRAGRRRRHRRAPGRRLGRPGYRAKPGPVRQRRPR